MSEDRNLQYVTDIPPIPMQMNQGVLIATVQVDLSSPVMAKFQNDLLDRIRSSSAKKVVMDLSGVTIMDSQEFHQIKKTIAMAKLMGAHCIIVGLTAGVVSSLVDLGINFSEIEAAANLEGANRMFHLKK